MPAKKVRKTNANKQPPKPAIPPVEVADLTPPLPNKTLGDAFDVLWGMESGNPDLVSLVPVCVAFEDDQSEGEELEPHVPKKPCIKSPIKSKWIVPIVHCNIRETQPVGERDKYAA